MDYSSIDEKIIEAVKNGNKNFTRIYEHMNGVSHHAKGPVISAQVLDRRLQVLRRKGKLIWTGSAFRSGWRLPEEKTA